MREAAGHAAQTLGPYLSRDMDIILKTLQSMDLCSALARLAGCSGVKRLILGQGPLVKAKGVAVGTIRYIKDLPGDAIGFEARCYDEDGSPRVFVYCDTRENKEAIVNALRAFNLVRGA